MMRKFKFWIFFIIFLLVFLISSNWVIRVLPKNVIDRDTDTLITIVKFLVPVKVRIFLAKTIYTPTNLAKIDVLKAKFKYLVFKPKSKSYAVKSKSNSYIVKNFPLPFTSYNRWRLKPVAYLEQTDNEVVIASGNGEFFSFAKKDIELENLSLKRIKSNIKNLIQYNEFYSPDQNSIRDLLMLDNNIFFSFNNQVTKDCYNTSIMISKFNLNYLNFSEFFSYENCVSAADVTHGGGRIVPFNNEKILFTIGEHGSRVLAQDKNSMFGKIISIDLKTKDYNIIAMGSRNAQGLYYDKDRNIIIHTEHGPRGGMKSILIYILIIKLLKIMVGQFPHTENIMMENSEKKLPCINHTKTMVLLNRLKILLLLLL